MRRLVTITLALVVAATAFASTADGSTVRTIDADQEDTAPRTVGPANRPAAALVSQSQSGSAFDTFGDCDSLLDRIQTEALSRVSADGLDRGQFGEPRDDDDLFEDEFDDDDMDAMMGEGFDDDVMMDDGEALDFESEMGAADGMADDSGGPLPDAAADSPAAAPESGEFSETNVQVAGVDEPDIVKTDGRRIITVSKGVLTVVDVSGAEPTTTGHVVLTESRSGEVLLHGDRALVIRNDNGSIRPGEVVADRSERSREIVVIDEVLLDGLPRRGRSLRIEGRYVSSRSIGATARIVINSFPEDPGFVRPLSNIGVPVAAAVNRRVIEETTLDDWLPDYTLIDALGSEPAQTESLLSCERVHVPVAFSGFGTASVLTVDLTEPLAPGDGAATFAAAETVYASLENMYVATSDWVPASVLQDPDRSVAFADGYATSIHKFSLHTSGAAEYQASGSVAGHLLNQFALHEFDRHLFVATTDGPPWRFGTTESRIVALRQRGDALVEVGQVGDMGRGERIFAVRYIADRAYVVTYRQVDPLYVVDLGDPTQPAVLGELKIPGFSSYLHPIGDGLLVGVGRDVTERGWDRGLKISLFDVADATDPQEIDTWTLRDSHSEVGSDHRSFLWWGRDQLMVLPVSAPNRTNRNQALAFRVTRSEGLRELGYVSHTPAEPDISTECHHEFVEPGEEDMIRDTILRLICRQGQAPNATGYRCGQSTVGRVAWTETERSSLPTTVSDEDLIYWCRPREGERLRRSLIIGDDLWTMSASLLQRNDLETLRRSDRLPLPAADEVIPPTVTRFADCPALLERIRTQATSRVGPHGFEHGRYGRPSRRSPAPGHDMDLALAFADDRRTVTAFENTLTVTDTTGNQPRVVGSTPLDVGQPLRLLLHGDRAIVIGEQSSAIPHPGLTSAGEDSGPSVVVREFLVDGRPQRGRSLHVEGSFVAAHSDDGTARVVIRSIPRDLGLVSAGNDSGELFAIEANRRTLAQATLEDWLPDYALVAATGLVLREGRLLTCEQVFVPDQFSGFGTLSVMMFDHTRSITVGGTTAIFAEGASAEVSGSSLDVSVDPWPISRPSGGKRRLPAAIHSFSLTGTGVAEYRSSRSAL